MAENVGVLLSASIARANGTGQRRASTLNEFIGRVEPANNRLVLVATTATTKQTVVTLVSNIQVVISGYLKPDNDHRHDYGIPNDM